MGDAKTAALEPCPFCASRIRNVFASLAKLEAAVALDPMDRGLQLNLAGCRKIALQMGDANTAALEPEDIVIRLRRVYDETGNRLLRDALDAVALGRRAAGNEAALREALHKALSLIHVHPRDMSRKDYDTFCEARAVLAKEPDHG